MFRTTLLLLAMTALAAAYHQIHRSEDITHSRARREETISIFSVANDLEVLSSGGLPEFTAGVAGKVVAKLDAFEAEILADLNTEYERLSSLVTKAVAANLKAAREGIDGRLTLVEKQVMGKSAAVATVVSQGAQTLRAQVTASTAAVKQVDTMVSQQILQWRQQTARGLAKCVSAAKAGDVKLAAAVVAAKSRAASTASQVVNAAKSVDQAFKARVTATLIEFPPVVKSVAHMNNGADNGQLLAMQITKVLDDTVLRITFNGGARLITSGRVSRWWFRVDGADCRDAVGNGRGHIDGVMHGSGIDLHRVLTLDGVCFRKSNGLIKKGLHTITFHIAGNGDAYTGWSSNNRMTVQEVTAPKNVY